MKKFAFCILVAALGASSQVQAANEPTSQLAAKGGRYTFGIFQESANTLHPQPTNVISRSNPTYRACWSVIADTPVFGSKVNVKEVFTSPAGSSFTDGKSIVQSSIDGTKHTVSNMADSIAQSSVQRCWKFDNNDPIGTYTLTVEVDGVPTPAQTFEVTP